MDILSHRQYKVPNLPNMIDFPWPGTHPQLERATTESIGWLESYRPLGSNGETRSFFDKTKAGILGGYTYLYANYDQLRACTDFINVIYVLDEITDLQSGQDARATMQKHLRVLFGGKSDEDSISYISADLRKRLYETFDPASLERLFKDYETTIMEMVTEAEHRERKRILSFEDYKEFRLTQGATYPVFDLIESCYGFILPDEVFEDTTFKALREEAMYIICWTNDICSYNNEQSAEGHAYANVVTVLMNEKNIALQQAMDLIGRITEAHFKQYNEYKKQLRSFGNAVDADLQDYIYGMDCWVAGEIQYAFSIPKYFGQDLARARKTCIVDLK